MFSCCKAQSRGLGRTTASTLPRHDSTHFRGHASLVSTSVTTHHVSNTKAIHNGRKSVAKERQRAERDQLTRLLKESPVKRDAKNFLKHFDTPTQQPAPAAPATGQYAKEAVERAHHNEWRLTKTGVNLGNLYEPTKAVQDSPVFTREERSQKKPPEKSAEPLHLALVKLRQPQALDDTTLGGIALTLSQMAKLGLNIAVVVDCDENGASTVLEPDGDWMETVREQTSRIVDALEDFNEPGAFAVDHSLCHSSVDTEIPSTVQVRGGVEVKNNYLLFPPIEDGIIPVIPPLAYDSELKKVRVRADDVVLALTREFAGITTQNVVDDGPQELDDALYDINQAAGRPVMDRLIILDPLGGIPSVDRTDGAHVFINLEAEYQDIRSDLQQAQKADLEEITPTISSLGNSNPFSKFVETEIAPLPGSEAKQISNVPLPSRHVQNLDAVHRALRLLPPSSSALIITPDEAAISSQVALLDKSSTGVRTRRSKNPLIHNLLTDKPMISSSLPAPLVNRPVASAAPNPATFLKKGIPVTMVPDPRTTGPWQPPSPSHPSIELENDPRINFPRLVDLIEDSFRRKLDARDYLDRIRGRVAGVIIAGDYEGGAICTWETPQSLSTTSQPSPSDATYVPYLDKFAVLTSSQGSGGVADIVWGALTRSAFPDGVVWRSRKSNPVNKWYFERSVGMWNLPDGYWTMFWTTEGVVDEYVRVKGGRNVVGGEDGGGGGALTRWDAYVDVCGGVQPSWKDGSRPD